MAKYFSMKDCVADVLEKTMSMVLKIESKFPFQYEVDILFRLIIVHRTRRMVKALNWIVSHPLFKRGFLLPNCFSLSLSLPSFGTCSQQTKAGGVPPYYRYFPDSIPPGVCPTKRGFYIICF